MDLENLLATMTKCPPQGGEFVVVMNRTNSFAEVAREDLEDMGHETFYTVYSLYTRLQSWRCVRYAESRFRWIRVKLT